MLKKWLRSGVLLGLLALLCCLGAGAEEPILLEYEGPIVRNTTEAFPIYTTTFSGSAPAWNDAAAFENGVYEGYYAQLDSISQGFYRQLQTVLADPATAFTSANKKTVNVGTTAAPVYLTAYTINVPYPAGVTFPSVTAATQAQAETRLGTLVYRHALPALDALGRDHPEMPWLSASWGISGQFSMLRKTESTGEITLAVSTGKPLQLILVNPSPTVLNGCKNGTYQSAVDAAVNTLDTDSRYGLGDPGKTDLDKVRAIHDFLCRQIVYASDGDSSTALDQNAYSALVSPYKTVCAGYTASAKLLCDHYGIPCVNVTGLGGERHAWNYVCMDDGAWYAMDCTWDDVASGEPLYDFFLKGSATAVPYGWGASGVIPFPQSHIATSTWSNYTVMPYPTLAQDDYVGYVLSAAPTARATYGSLYSDVALTGGEVKESAGGPAVTGGKWFAGAWTDRDRATRTISAQSSYPATLEVPVYFSQNPAFDPIHIYSDPFDYPVTATAALTVDRAPLTIQKATVSVGTVTAVTFGGLKNGESLTLGTDYTASAVQSGNYYNVTVTLLDTDLTRNYVLDEPTFNTSRNDSAARPTGASVSPNRLNLVVGQSQRVQLTFTPADALQPTVAWATGDPSVATVDATGLVTAVGVGATQLAITPDGFATNSIPITVTAAPAPTGLELSEAAISLTLGKNETCQLSASILPAGAGGVVRWSSDLPRVATVSSSGLVTPKGTGFAVVTAGLYANSSSGTPIATAQCMVSVFENNVPATKVTLTPGYRALNVGNTLQLTYTLLPAGVTDQTVSWTSSDPNVASVSPTGLVTAVSKGTATVTLTTATPGVRASCEVEAKVPVTAVKLDVHTLELIVGDATVLAATVTPANSSYPDVTWTSSDPSVVTVDDAGRVTALGPGTATITATAGSISAPKSDSCTVTVLKSDADYGENALAVTNASSASDTFTYGDVLQLTFLPQRVATLMADVQPDRAALYLGDTLLTGPVAADLDGKYVLRYDTAQGLVPLGDQVLTFRYGGSNDLNAGGVEVPIHLEPKALEASMLALELPGEGYIYDGEEKVPAVAVTDCAGALGEDDYTLSYRDNVNAGTATVTVSGQGWYTGTVERTFSIAKQAGKVVHLTAASVPWDVTELQSLDLAPAVAELALESDTPTYDAVTVTTGEAYLQGEPSVDSDGLLTLALSALVDTPGSVTLTVPVTGLGNYDTVDVAVTVPVVEDAEVTVDLSDLVLADRAYNGQGLAYTGQAAGSCNGGAYTGKFTYTWQDAEGNDLPAAPVDAGTYRLLVQTATPGFRGQGSKTVTITPAPVTVTAGTCRVSKVYDGATDPGEMAGALAVTGILPQDADVSVTAAAGAYASADAGERQVSAALTLTGDERHNYVLAAETVLLPGVIAPRTATVTAADQRVTYGEPIAQGLDRAAASGLLAGHSLGALTLTADGQGAIVPSAAALVDAQGRDVTGNYALTYVPGVLTVLEPQVAVAQGPVWDGVQSAVTLSLAPVGLLERPGVLILAARYEDGAMVELVRGNGAGDTVTFAADLTAGPRWKLFFLGEELAPLCGAAALD